MPLVLAGEGHYALSDVKTLEVTEEFVGLGEKVTKVSDGGVQGGLSVQQVQGEGSLSVPVLPLEPEDPLWI